MGSLLEAQETHHVKNSLTRLWEGLLLPYNPTGWIFSFLNIQEPLQLPSGR